MYCERDFLRGYAGGGAAEILQSPDRQTPWDMVESCIVLYEITDKKRVARPREVLHTHACHLEKSLTIIRFRKGQPPGQSSTLGISDSNRATWPENPNASLLSLPALAEPLPEPKPAGPGGSCPHGWSASGSFCVPRQGAQDAVPLPPNGACPHGWTRSGSFCPSSGR